MGIGFNPEEIDLVKLRERLRQMNDAELRSFGRDAARVNDFETGTHGI